jgi:hypothetical protein
LTGNKDFFIADGRFNVYAWLRFTMKLVQEQRAQKTRELSQANRMVVVGAIAFFLLVGCLSIHRHVTFFSNTDHGIFNQ